jgi:hypothetical protein
VASNSNRDVLLRMTRDSRVEPLAMGPYRGREDVWRAGIDHAFGFDPGRTLDAVLEAIDAEQPRNHFGEVPYTGEWPCATPLPPTDDLREYDEYGDEYEDEDPLPDWWSEQLPEEHEPHVDAPPQAEQEWHAAVDEEEHHDEPAHDGGGDHSWAEAMTETPVDLEDDGSEPTPLAGHEDEHIDFEAVPAPKGDVCFRCDSEDPAVEECDTCGREVCPRCACVENDIVRCRACVP